jgi:hypothetical protein
MDWMFLFEKIGLPGGILAVLAIVVKAIIAQQNTIMDRADAQQKLLTEQQKNERELWISTYGSVTDALKANTESLREFHDMTKAGLRYSKEEHQVMTACLTDLTKAVSHMNGKVG